MIYDKPYKNYSQLISKLVHENGLIINNTTYAEDALRTFSYYDLINGYKNIFTTDNEIFFEDTTIESIVEFHIFNMDFQAILLHYSIIVENRFKNILANVISKSISVDETIYLDRFYYRNQIGRIKIDDVLSNVKKSLNTYDQPTSHYVENHNHVPPWILFKNVSFSDCINLFSLTNSNLRKLISRELLPYDYLTNDEKSRTSQNALTIIRKYRNRIAHNLNFICSRIESRHLLEDKVLEKGFLGTLITQEDITMRIGQKDIYSMILSLVLLLEHPLLIEKFLSRIQNLIQDDNGPSLFETYSSLTDIPLDLAHRINHYFQSN